FALLVITHRSPENYDPITWFGRVPVYATTIIVALYVACMIGVAVAGLSAAQAALSFDAVAVLHQGEIWRCLTYAFVNGPDPLFIISLVMLYIFGRDVEQYLGRKGFVRLYLGFLLLGPSLLLAASLVTGQNFALVRGWANFAVFLAFASLYPNALLLLQIPAKVFAWVFLGLSVLQLLAGRQWPDMFILLATTFLAYYAIRHGAALNLDFMSRLRPVSHSTKRPRLRVVKNPDDEPVDPHRIIDPLLEKISRDGLASLTRREREQLERARTVLLERERS
ncbi:MAG: rhomboid family intramembrane serine protease, partial [Chthoniobacterales bacterium]